jgi:general stress protein 26
MSDVNDDTAERRLWKEVEDTRFGMLGLADARQHFQPMTAFAEPAEGAIWFFTRNDTDLATTVAQGEDQAMFVIQSKDQDFQGCIGGTLTEARDQARIDRYWNPMVAAWYPDGKDDPNLTLLRFDVSDAEVWISKGGAIRLAWEVAKANLSGTTPDVGTQKHLNLN